MPAGTQRELSEEFAGRVEIDGNVEVLKGCC